MSSFLDIIHIYDFIYVYTYLLTHIIYIYTIHVHAYINIYIYIYIYKYKYINIYTYIYINTNIYIYINININIYVYIYIYIYTSTLLYVCVCICVYICIHVYVHKSLVYIYNTYKFLLWHPVALFDCQSQKQNLPESSGNWSGEIDLSSCSAPNSDFGRCAKFRLLWLRLANVYQLTCDGICSKSPPSPNHSRNMMPESEDGDTHER